ncbi:MAG: 30S ribosomal protein S17 [Candidatus Doudnabacteria bacterium]|nr:30S ribosomal protein S17 [Candidatus Doudnabacteria bacterium]
MSKRTLIGIVDSNKMTKTIVVKVSSVKVHPKYHKRYEVAKRYPAHNELEGIQIGDKVEIQESKPFSKTVNWVVTKKV